MRYRLIPFLIFAAISCSDSGGFAHISMIDNQFSPKLQKIPVGGIIEFVNKGDNPHNALALDKSWGTEKAFGSPVMNKGDKVRVTFPEKGVFPYLCTFHASPDGQIGMTGNIVVGDVEYNPNQRGKKWTETSSASGRTRRVPSEYPTIQNAVDAAVPGDLILISSGIYKEEVVVTTPSLVIRGEDRNRVVLDGEFTRSNGIMVMGANGVAVENMTAMNHVLNGFFWTGVTGYRGSYLTAINNGDYGLYAFDSTDGVFEYSYGSGSPDSSFYVGQCYPCRAILHDLVGEDSAMGYSGTNSGGDLYLIRNVFRNNIIGVGPNTLDSELLPPQRETNVSYNLIMDNGNQEAPIKPLTWPGYGNGVMIAGANRNVVENNVIIGHPNHGILVIPNLQENFWISHDNVIRNNTILNSGRADIALVGPVAPGNCFTGNDYRTSSPFGLQLLNSCDSPLRYFAGGDLSVLVGGLGMMIEARLKWHLGGDYKTRAHPGPQMEMPAEWKSTVVPAHNVFESRRSVLNRKELPEGTDRILADVNRKGMQLLGIRPLLPNTVLTMIFHFFLFLLPFVVYSSWTSLALSDIIQRKASPILGFAVVFVPLLGSFVYLIAKGESLPGWLRKTSLFTGAGVFLIVLLLGLPFII